MTAALDTPPAPQPALNADHRRRLLEAMAETVARKGFAETTIADLAAQAHVSRRTFYEHFDSKAECLIALYRAASRSALSVLVEAIDPARDWQQQLDAALHAYLAKLASNPVLLSTLFIEVLHLGTEGLQARRKVNEELADFLLQVVNSAGHARPLPPAMAMGVVGAANELILQAIENNQHDRLTELTPLVARLVCAVAAAS